MDIFNYEISGKSISKSDYKKLIESWKTIIDRYYKISFDVPFYYNERANISLLAGASHNIGWTCLEEYRSDKLKTLASSRSRSKSKGRVDLFIGTEKSKFYIIEAKQKWNSLQSILNKSTVTGARRFLNDACQDSLKSHNEIGKRIGLLFITVSCLRNEYKLLDKSLIEDKVPDFCQKVLGKSQSWFYTYYFPKFAAKKDFMDKKTGRIWPGIIMLGKYTRYSKKG